MIKIRSVQHKNIDPFKLLYIAVHRENEDIESLPEDILDLVRYASKGMFTCHYDNAGEPSMEFYPGGRWSSGNPSLYLIVNLHGIDASITYRVSIKDFFSTEFNNNSAQLAPFIQRMYELYKNCDRRGEPIE